MTDNSSRKRIAGRRRTRPVSATVPETEPEEMEEASPDIPASPDLPASSDAPASSEASERTSRTPVLVAALAAALVATLVVGGILGQKAWSNHQRDQGRSVAAGAAAKAAALVLSYDYRRLDQDFGAARQTLTPEFRTRFDQTTKVVGEQATKTKASVKAEVREVSVSSSSADVVTVLLFVNQTTTSTVTQGKPRVDLNRARFTMVRNDGTWLVQEVAGL